MPQGKVKEFDYNSGNGRITQEDGSVISFHDRDIYWEGATGILPGNFVRYEIVDGVAKQVSVITVTPKFMQEVGSKF